MDNIPLPPSFEKPERNEEEVKAEGAEEKENPTDGVKKKAMCEEISYDEIYMPGEFEKDADGPNSHRQAVVVAESAKNEDCSAAANESESKCSAVHPPNEIVEDVMRHIENEISKGKEKEKEKQKEKEKEKEKERGKEKEKDRDREKARETEKDKKKASASTPDSSDSDRPRRKRSSSRHRRRKAGRSSPTYSDSDSSESSRSRSRSPRKSRHRRKRSPPRKRARSSSSSSRGTYEGLELFLPEDECPYSCKKCRRGFYTIKELAEHEIRAHDMKIPCAHCDKDAVSVTKLAAHMLFRHASHDVVCYYCDEKFGGPADKLDKSSWDDFRGHVYKEVLKKKMYEHSSKTKSSSSDAVALRGVGRCPHGAAVKCRNFPNCPGAKCIYSHGMCRYDITCNKSSCPFDHTNRPRVCMTCLNDIRGERRRRY
ncbi:hypothetical protein V3C99_003102 [Haemonchus contortus]